jgi:hypothetical protein
MRGNGSHLSWTWLILFGAAVLVFLLALGYRWAEREGHFDLMTVRVRGCRQDSDSSMVADVVRPFMRQPLGKVDCEIIRESLLAMEGVSGVRVRKSWPATIRIDLSLAVPALRLTVAGATGVSVISMEGERLPASFDADTLPRVVLSAVSDSLAVPALLAWASDGDLPVEDSGHLVVDNGCVCWIDEQTGDRVILGSSDLAGQWELLSCLRSRGLIDGDWSELDLRFDGQVILRRDGTDGRGEDG